MKDLSEFNSKLYNEIVMLVESGNLQQDDKKLNEALDIYLKAWGLIPDPKSEWELSSWVASCLFTLYFDLSNFKMAKEWAKIALENCDSEINTAPLIDLGMVCYELGQNDEAIKYVDKAYQYGQARAFQDRPKKYLNYYLESKRKS